MVKPTEEEQLATFRAVQQFVLHGPRSVNRLTYYFLSHSGGGELICFVAVRKCLVNVAQGRNRTEVLSFTERIDNRFVVGEKPLGNYFWDAVIYGRCAGAVIYGRSEGVVF